MNDQWGEWTFGPIAGLIIVVLAIIGFFAVCTGGDDDNPRTMAPTSIQLVSHYEDGGYGDCEYEDCYQGGDGYDQDNGSDWSNRDNDNRQRRSFSPGPFDRSPIDMRNACISLDCSGRDKNKDREDEPRREPMTTQSLFPPTPEGIKNFVVQTVKGGIEMGRLFADTTITFISNLMVGIA